MRLAQLAGFSAHPQLSKVPHARSFSATALKQGRLRALASLINFAGEVTR